MDKLLITRYLCVVDCHDGYTLTLQDLLAVGYGQFDFSNQKSGLICCWSIKNPEVCEKLDN